MGGVEEADDVRVGLDEVLEARDVERQRGGEGAERESQDSREAQIVRFGGGGFARGAQEIVDDHRGDAADAGVHAGHGGGEERGDQQAGNAVGQGVDDEGRQEAVAGETFGEEAGIGGLAGEEAEADEQQRADHDEIHGGVEEERAGHAAGSRDGQHALHGGLVGAVVLHELEEIADAHDPAAHGGEREMPVGDM